MSVARLLSASLLAAVTVACSKAESRGESGARPPADAGAFATAGSAQGADAAASDPMVVRADSGRVRGSADAKVWLVVISDFQCPFCRMWHDSSDAAIRRDYVDNGKVRLAFVNLPLSQHKHARPAAEAAMCASAQGKFWEMHDAIFAAQEQWQGLEDARPAFEKLAADAGVDVAAMKACVASGKMQPLVQADYRRALDAGVRSTPSFFVGDKSLSGVVPLEEMRRALDEALAAAGTR